MHGTRIFQPLATILLFTPFLAGAQTFTGAGAAIPDNGNTLNIPLGVTGLAANLDVANFGLEQVCVSITHSWLSDLHVSLVAPDGTVVLLTSEQGGDSDHFSNTCFRQDAPVSIMQGAPPIPARSVPKGTWASSTTGRTAMGSGTCVCWTLTRFPTRAT